MLLGLPVKFIKMIYDLNQLMAIMKGIDDFKVFNDFKRKRYAPSIRFSLDDRCLLALRPLKNSSIGRWPKPAATITPFHRPFPSD